MKLRAREAGQKYNCYINMERVLTFMVENSCNTQEVGMVQGHEEVDSWKSIIQSG